MIILLQCYALVWMLITSYNAYCMLDRQRRVKRANDIIENGHIYDRLLAVMSPRVFVGIFVAMELVVIAVDLYGFLLAVTYIEAPRWQHFALAAIVACYLYECMRSFTYIRKFPRILERTNEPMKTLARYLRLTLCADSIATYVSYYGKCLVAVKLFLAVISPGVSFE